MKNISENLIEEAKQAVKRLKFEFPYSIEEWINQKNLLMENYHKHTTWSDLVQIDSTTNIEDFIINMCNNDSEYKRDQQHIYSGKKCTRQ